MSDDPLPPDAQEVASQRTERATKMGLAERRITFGVLRRQGMNISQAARLSGFSRGAAYRLERLQTSPAQVESTGLNVEHVMTRDEGAATLSALLRDPNVPAAYKAPLASALTRLMSWDSAPPPVESQREQRSPSNFITWLNGAYREDLSHRDTCPACGRKLDRVN